MKYMVMSVFTLMLVFSLAHAEEFAPWDKSQVMDIKYAPNKVVYDVAVSNVETFERVLDRASYLNKVYNADPFNASIVLVLHGDEINFFAIKNHAKYKELMRRAQSLTVGGIIKMRMCKIAAKGHGYDPEDIHGFIEMVPMADAEIVRLQVEQKYAYMQ